MRYQIGGTLSPNDPTYVERQADTDLYQALKKGDFCYTLNSRQMGKSSLMVKTKYRLQQEGYRCTTIDMTNIGTENITSVEWYKGIVAELWSGLNLFGTVKLSQWWQEHEDSSPLQKLGLFITEVILAKCPEDDFCIFIDEIDNVKQLPFSVDDFFSFIRYCYNQRATDSRYNRLTFAIFGVTSSYDLIQDKQRTPFNIGRPITLGGFSLQEARPLAVGLNLPESQSLHILERVLYWTGGQPFLTQKLCKLLLQICPQSLGKDYVQKVVQGKILDRWEYQDEPEHLRTVRDRILGNPLIKGRLLGIYQRILAGEKVKVDRSVEQTELLLSGLVVKDRQQLKVKNPIYEAIFDRQWVKQQLDDLRPYARKINAWLASQQQDSSQLLQGKELKRALQWSKNKQLGDIDYRFLNESQNIEKQQVEKNLYFEKQQREQAQFALKTAKDANDLSTASQRTSRQKAKHLRPHSGWIGILAGGFAFLILLVRMTGLFQGAEWMLGDLFFRLDRPNGITSDRITLITIDEKDLQNLGQFPVSNRILAQAIDKLTAANPRVIGLDVYRNFSLEPQEKSLAQLTKKTPNLIVTEKVMGSKIATSSLPETATRVSFNDRIIDGDGKIRRALLSKTTDTQDRQPLSFLFKLAVDYLKLDSNRVSAAISDSENPSLWLKGAKINSFQSNDGGYIRANDDGFQVLINYQGTKEQFTNYSLSQLLEGKVPIEAIGDRIILIGSTAKSFNELYQTPYSANESNNSVAQMPGVVIDANVISQLVSSALDEQPGLKTWSEPIEWLWIILWCLIGAAVGWWLQSLLLIVVGGVVSIIVLVTFSYLTFLNGWLIPLFPCLLGLALSSKTFPLVAAKQLKRVRLRHTVGQIMAVKQQQPAVVEVALEYLKQGESDKNRAYINRLVREKEIKSDPGLRSLQAVKNN